MRILVTGGSGVLGSQVVERLRAAGQRPIVLSRRASSAPDWVRGDIATGEGLPEALAGVEVVVHAASAAAEFTKIKGTDIEGTRRLVEAAETAGVKHLVYISIVGIDRIPYVYYKAKVAAEELVKAGAVPWTIQRATQFPELLDRVLRASRGPFVFVPGSISFQPVDSVEVAERLAQLATSAPAGKLEDFGGPEVLTTRELAQTWLAHRGMRKRIVSFPIPGKVGRAFRAGYHLCPEHRQGRGTWVDWIGRAYAGGQVPTAYSRKSEPDRDG
jgi:uncharacterized protein YbjT (DUF2867 family)